MTDYDEQRAKVGAVALKIFHDYGRDRTLDMCYGAIDALTYAILSIHPQVEIKLAVDNTKPVEPPFDCEPAA